MNGICCIVGAGDNSGTELFIPKGAYVIAADGGLETLRKAGITPDLIIGDFDSLQSPLPEGNVIRLPVEKDDTDTMAAVRRALALGCNNIIIYGGLGGRLDHSLANLQLLLYISRNGAKAFLVGDGVVCTAVTNGGLRLAKRDRGTVSVFSADSAAEGVAIEGLKYTLNEYTMSNFLPLGVSNEFIGREALIKVGQGSLLIICQDGCFSPDNYKFV